MRHKEIVGNLLPDDAEWISITVPLDNVFSQYEKVFSSDGYVSMLRGYGHGNPGSTSESLYFIMGNGSRIRVDTAADSVSNIAGVRVLRMIELTDELLKR